MARDSTASESDIEAFLKADLHDALKGLFVSAVNWAAHPEHSDERGVRGLAMYANCVQARALYEFYFGRQAGNQQVVGGDARALDFAPSWVPSDRRNLYGSFMGPGSAAQKRVFHLVYGRPGYSGGTAPDESDHLKNQVRAFTEHLRQLTTEFAHELQPRYRALVETSLEDALTIAREVARNYGVTLAELA